MDLFWTSVEKSQIKHCYLEKKNKSIYKQRTSAVVGHEKMVDTGHNLATFIKKNSQRLHFSMLKFFPEAGYRVLFFVSKLNYLKENESVGFFSNLLRKCQRNTIIPVSISIYK